MIRLIIHYSMWCAGSGVYSGRTIPRWFERETDHFENAESKIMVFLPKKYRKLMKWWKIINTTFWQFFFTVIWPSCIRPVRMNCSKNMLRFGGSWFVPCKSFQGQYCRDCKKSGIDFNGITCLLFCASILVRTISKYLETGALLHASIVYVLVKC